LTLIDLPGLTKVVVAYGVIKETNEIVEVTLKHIEEANKARNEAREMVKQRNCEIAIEVSHLEATISWLSDEVSQKSSQIEALEKSFAEKDAKLAEIKSGMSEGLSLVENERLELTKLMEEYEFKTRDLEFKMESQRSWLVAQLCFVSLQSIYELSRIVIAKTKDVVEEKSREVQSLNETVCRCLVACCTGPGEEVLSSALVCMKSELQFPVWVAAAPFQ